MSTTSSTGTQGCGIYPTSTATTKYSALAAPALVAGVPSIYTTPGLTVGTGVNAYKIPSLDSAGTGSLPIGMTVSSWPFTRALFAEGFTTQGTLANSAAYCVLQPVYSGIAAVPAGTPGGNSAPSFFKSPLFKSSFFTQ